MQEGLLWFDKDPRHAPADKATEAAAHYQAKFGIKPDTCFFNPADLNGENGTEVNGVRLRTASNVLRYHLRIGVENKARMAIANGK